MVVMDDASLYQQQQQQHSHASVQLASTAPQTYTNAIYVNTAPTIEQQRTVTIVAGELFCNIYRSPLLAMTECFFFYITRFAWEYFPYFHQVDVLTLALFILQKKTRMLPFT